MTIYGFVLASWLPLVAFQALLLLFTRKAKRNWTHQVGLLIFTLALVCMMQLTGISFSSLSQRNFDWDKVNLTPFRVIKSMLEHGNSGVGRMNVFGNILLFVPIGMLLPILWDCNGFFRTVFVGACISLGIEVLQMYLPRTPDVDDLILNTAGTMLGYIAGGLMKRLSPRFVGGMAVPNGGVLLPAAFSALAMCSAMLVEVAMMWSWGMF